jgi:hypothetical protein
MLFSAIYPPTAKFVVNEEIENNVYLKNAISFFNEELKYITPNSFPKFEVEITQNNSSYIENLKEYYFTLTQISHTKNSDNSSFSRPIKIMDNILLETS